MYIIDLYYNIITYKNVQTVIEFQSQSRLKYLHTVSIIILVLLLYQCYENNKVPLVYKNGIDDERRS